MRLTPLSPVKALCVLQERDGLALHTSLLPTSFIKFPESCIVTILKRSPVREPKPGVLHSELSCLEGGENRSPLEAVWCRLRPGDGKPAVDGI